jgi:hypothetical protein
MFSNRVKSQYPISTAANQGCGIDFLENWVQQNVTEADKKGSPERAKELADKCLAEPATVATK